MTGREEARSEGLQGQGPWLFKLYVVDETPRCMNALAAIRRVCEAHLPGQYAIEVIDLKQTPAVARMDQIVAVPTLVRVSPSPKKTLIGDLSAHAAVLHTLGLGPFPQAA